MSGVALTVADFTRITYTGPATLAANQAVTLFSSTVAFGPRAAPHYRCYTFRITYTNSVAGGGITFQKSSDGGVTWTTRSSTGFISSETIVYTVSEFADWRVTVQNGATPTVFVPDMIITHNP